MSRLAHDIDATGPVLTVEEETELAIRIEVGVLASERLHDSRLENRMHSGERAELQCLVDEGRLAWSTLLERSLRIVRMVAREVGRTYRMPFDDLVHEGCLGLADALMRFDHTRGVRFATFAVPWVRAAMVAGARADLLVTSSGPWHVRTVATVMGARRALEAGGVRPTPEAVAERLGRDVSWVRDRWLQPTAVPLDPVLEETVGAVEVVVDDWWLDEIPSDHAVLLARRFGLRGREPERVDDLARSLEVSASAVRRLERVALDEVREVVLAARAA